MCKRVSLLEKKAIICEFVIDAGLIYHCNDCFTNVAEVQVPHFLLLYIDLKSTSFEFVSFIISRLIS